MIIDEKRLIEEMNKTFPDKFLNEKNWFCGKCSFMDLFSELIENQPKVGEWIPCSERLPKKDGAYLCWCKGSLYPCACIRKFAKDLYSIDKYDFTKESGGGFYYYESDWGYSKDTDVIAWQSLPEPYKAGDT